MKRPNLTQEHKDKISKTLSGVMIGNKNPNWKGGLGRKEIDKRKKIKMKTWMGSIKSQTQCAVCGEKDIRCLDFHHINRADKIMSVGEMASRFFNKDSILREISKCSVLCSNCHRKLHSDN